MYGPPNSVSLLNNLMYASFPSFTTKSNQALPAALYTMTYLVRAGGSSSSGFLVAGRVGLSVGAWVGSPVGALLVPGCGFYMGWVSVWFGGFGIWWGFLRRGLCSFCGLRWLFTLGLTCTWFTFLWLLFRHLPALMGGPSSVSSSRASLNCSSGPALPLPMPVNVAVVMPTGQWDVFCLVVFAWFCPSIQIN